MKKIFLVTFLLTSFNAFSAFNTIHLNNIDIRVFNENKVQVFKDDVHMFGVDCNNGILCSVFVSYVSSSKYKIFDGVVQLNSEVLELSAKNIQSVANKNRSLVFIMSSGNASGSYANIQEFEINSNTGAFYHTTRELDWMRYGHPNDYPLNR